MSLVISDGKSDIFSVFDQKPMVSKEKGGGLGTR